MVVEVEDHQLIIANMGQVVLVVAERVHGVVLQELLIPEEEVEVQVKVVVSVVQAVQV